jgi:dipeptidyl aminopeptidase/acylaminoacyl peptidase
MENIIKREIVKLNSTQTKMLISGWGEEVHEKSIVEKICYSSDGLKVKGYLAYPSENKDMKFPCVIWNRGGYQNRGAIDHFTARGIFGQIASWGYVVFTSQYRGNDGAEGKEEIGGADVNDIINLIPLADEINFADKDKWAIMGWSRGGMMALLALLKVKIFRCAVITGAISDMKNYISDNNYLSNFYKNEITGNFDEEVEKRTVINKVDLLPRIPYLIMHGGNDETIPAEQSIILAQKLQELEHELRLVIFEKGDHYLKSHRKEVESLTRLWFKKYL